MDEMSQFVIDFVKTEGACAAGIATVETLAGGPPSADLSYIRADAKSAISFAVPLDEEAIILSLKKESRLPLDSNLKQAVLLSNGISLALANCLELKGMPSTAIPANYRWRVDGPNGLYDLLPDISHRYLAVRSGVGYFGMSGNVITPNEGAAVTLGCVVTSAELVPTDPLPAEQNYCDRCGMCQASCASGFVDLREKVSVTLGGVEFSYAKRRDYFRCGYMCGGFNGLDSSGQWSTWSPGRFRVPENDGEFLQKTQQVIEKYVQWPAIEGGFYTPFEPWKSRLTCAHCQLVCAPDKEERKRRYEMIKNAGVVIQNPDGSLEAVSPEEAEKRLAAMSPKVRALYEED